MLPCARVTKQPAKTEPLTEPKIKRPTLSIEEKKQIIREAQEKFRKRLAHRRAEEK